jgi:hypothetical protein
VVMILKPATACHRLIGGLNVAGICRHFCTYSCTSLHWLRALFLVIDQRSVDLLLLLPALKPACGTLKLFIHSVSEHCLHTIANNNFIFSTVYMLTIAPHNTDRFR